MRVIPEKDIHKGHRKRMREKLSRHGSEIFDTYELLEMLLYLAIPVQDTNPIAKRLLAAFGSLRGVFSAKREELLLVEGVGERCADMILAAGDVLTLYGEARTLPVRDFSDYRAVGEFFTDYFGNAEDYRVALLLLDNAMRPIALKTLYNVDYSSAAVLPRPFVEAALSEGASVAIVAHTHPFGPIIPSYYDRETNSHIRGTCRRRRNTRGALYHGRKKIRGLYAKSKAHSRAG